MMKENKEIKLFEKSKKINFSTIVGLQLAKMWLLMNTYVINPEFERAYYLLWLLIYIHNYGTANIFVFIIKHFFYH